MIRDGFAHRGLRDFEEEQISRYEAELDNMVWRHEEPDMASYHHARIAIRDEDSLSGACIAACLSLAVLCTRSQQRLLLGSF